MLALFEVASHYGLEFEWIGMKQKGAMQAAISVTGFRTLTRGIDATGAIDEIAALVSTIPEPTDSMPSARRQNPRQKSQHLCSVPRPRRLLPVSLREGNARVRVQRNEIGSAGRDYCAELAKALARELLQIPIGDDSSFASVRSALEQYAITPDMKHLQQNGRHAFFKRLRTCSTFLKVYEDFVKDIIAPQVLLEFDDEDSAPETATEDGPANNDTRNLLYQFPPAVRIYCSHIGADPSVDRVLSSDFDGQGGPARAKLIEQTQAACRSLTKLHSDAQYGHQDGEVNYWMPLTTIDETSTLWAESRPGAGDWYPFYPLQVGEAWRFPGTNCRHFTKPNISGRTRISIDFRVSVASCYDANWKMVGNKERHEMRSVVC